MAIWCSSWRSWYLMATGIERLFRGARRRLIFLRGLASTMPRCSHEVADRMASYVCIEALNLVAEFNRNYFRVALNTGETRSGSYLATQFPRGIKIHDALRQMGVLRRPGLQGATSRLDEPSWHRKSQFLKVVRRSGLTTEQQIVSAIGLQVRVLDDLPTARNFFAHRNEETARRCRRLSRHYMLPSIHPTKMLSSRSRGGQVTVLEGWLLELETVSDLMTR